MSHHHQMMLQRYGLGRPADMPTSVNADPIFTPIFSALFSPIFAIGTAANTFAAGLSAAIATTSTTKGVLFA